jgi:hypothetical protein
MTDRPRTEEEMHLALHDRMLCGGLPTGTAPTKGTKMAQLAALGMAQSSRLPQFFRAQSLWHDPRTGTGNAPTIDFSWPHDWLVIPPDDMDLRAHSLRGRNVAIRWAWERAGKAAK